MHIVHINKKRGQDEVLVRCPNCVFAKKVPADKFSVINRLVKVKCKCGQIFLVKFDFRSSSRKQTRLEGYYHIIDHSDRYESHFYGKHDSHILPTNCHIRDISLHGIAIEVIGKNHLKVGNDLQVIFKLDNAMHDDIDKLVTVRFVKGQHVGCEFLEDERHRASIGFYLLA